MQLAVDKTVAIGGNLFSRRYPGVPNTVLGAKQHMRKGRDGSVYLKYRLAMPPKNNMSMSTSCRPVCNILENLTLPPLFK